MFFVRFSSHAYRLVKDSVYFVFFPHEVLKSRKKSVLMPSFASGPRYGISHPPTNSVADHPHPWHQSLGL